MTNKKKKWLIIGLILVIILYIVIPAIYIDQKIKKEDVYGTNIVIKGDTLMVVGFDVDTQNYILDDGRQVAERMVELFKIDDQKIEEPL